MVARSFLVWGAGIVAVLAPFLFFVITGWPGAPDSCLTDSPNTCYCEAFDAADVYANLGGVRQPWNTWLNLYAIGTSFVVALFVWRDRRRRYATRNIMRSMSYVPDAYVFAVLFLGLGSMWFHASIVQWAGVLDNLSMHLFASFLVFYTMLRLWHAEWAFWTFYLVTAIGFTVISWFWTWPLKSVVLIGIEVFAYLTLEVIIWVRERQPMMGRAGPILLWCLAVASILTAIVFWALSQTGEALCHQHSWFQPHGWLWHPLAGVMAVLLYFYWRCEHHLAR